MGELQLKGAGLCHAQAPAVRVVMLETTGRVLRFSVGGKGQGDARSFCTSLGFSPMLLAVHSCTLSLPGA